VLRDLSVGLVQADDQAAPAVPGDGAAGTTGSGGTTGTAGTGGTAGTTGSAGSTGTTTFSDNFEAQTLGSTTPTGWTRSGGSSGDFAIVSDTTQVLAQKGSTSSSVRMEYTGPLSSGTAVAASVKLTTIGSSNQAAMVCLHYTNSSNNYCVDLTPTGVQIKTVVGGTTGQSAVFAASVTTGTWYSVQLSLSSAGVLSASLGGTVLGTYTPAALTGGSAAVGTASMEAEFDNVVVTQ